MQQRGGGGGGSDGGVRESYFEEAERVDHGCVGENLFAVKGDSHWRKCRWERGGG